MDAQLRLLRQMHGLRLADVAEALGVTPERARQIETHPSDPAAERYAAAVIRAASRGRGKVAR